MAVARNAEAIDNTLAVDSETDIVDGGDVDAGDVEPGVDEIGLGIA